MIQVAPTLSCRNKKVGDEIIDKSFYPVSIHNHKLYKGWFGIKFCRVAIIYCVPCQEFCSIYSIFFLFAWWKQEKTYHPVLVMVLTAGGRFYRDTVCLIEGAPSPLPPLQWVGVNDIMTDAWQEGVKTHAWCDSSWRGRGTVAVTLTEGYVGSVWTNTTFMPQNRHKPLSQISLTYVISLFVKSVMTIFIC